MGGGNGHGSRMKRLTGLLVLFSLTVLMPTLPVSAEVSGVVLAPAIQEVTLDENQTEVTFEVTVANSTSQTVDLRLSTVDFGALDESGGVAFLGRSGQETTEYGLKEWMVLEKEHVVLESGENESVKVTIENKESLGPGGHYGAVLVSLARADNGEDSVAVLPAASTLVLLKKTGGEVTQLDLISVTANNSLSKFPSEANLRFQNSGNVHVVPRGTVEVLSPRGGVVAKGTINQASAFVLPGSFRQMSVGLSDSSRWLWPGRYKIVTTWRYDGQNETQQNVVEFIYLGSILSLIILFSCIVLICIVAKYTLTRMKVIHTSGKRKRFSPLRRR